MGARVLVVDREVAARRRLVAALGQVGLESGEAADGLAALYAVERQARAGAPFDVVVTQAALSDIDGIKLLALLKGRHPGLRVVVTASPETAAATAELVTRWGGDACVAHPVEPERLAAEVRDLAGSKGAAPARSAPAAQAAPAAPRAWVLVELDRAVEPAELRAALAGAPGVAVCDAVRDERFDLVLRLQGLAAGELEAWAKRELEGRAGVKSHESLATRAPQPPEELRGFLEGYVREHGADPEYRRVESRAAAYLVVDVHPPALADLYVRLYVLDEVLEIDAAADGRRLVLLLQGPDSAHLRRVVGERIRPLEGVARVRELKVVPFDEGGERGRA
ncbi:MAG: response regulator [Deltaproteobacteria bacterium]|nr:response regulator [Deltaproteobacteria bacterium]